MHLILDSVCGFVEPLVRAGDLVDVYSVAADIQPRFPEVEEHELCRMIGLCVCQFGGAALWERKPTAEQLQRR